MAMIGWADSDPSAILDKDAVNKYLRDASDQCFQR
jgi:hypothetical protein